MKNYFLFLALVASFASRLYGDNDNKQIPKPETVAKPTKTQLISSKNWKMIKTTYSLNGAPEVDFTGSYPSCALDNLYRFDANGNYSENEGTTKCDPADPKIISTGTWRFTKNDAKLKITKGTNVTEMDIAELNSTKIVLKAGRINQGTPYITTVTYRAQ
jgi:hypothetical protein